MPPTAPGPGSARRVTVAELAREHGVAADRVLAELHRIGIEALDGAAEIPDEAVFAVWPRLAAPRGRGAGAEPRAAVPQTRTPTPGMLEAFATEVVARWPLRRSEAAGVAQRWLGLQIDLSTALRFWSSGLGPYDHQLAAEWSRHGLRPEDLLRQVGGRSAGRRLRGGEPLGPISTALGGRGPAGP